MPDKPQVEFRAQTLPPGLAKLIALSQAVPEKSDAARKEVADFLNALDDHDDVHRVYAAMK